MYIITLMMSSILYGIQVLQVYMYYMSFPKDRIFVKCMVYAVFLLDTLQTVFFFHDAFQMFGYGFGDMATLKHAHLSGLSVPILTGLVSLIVQSFYAHQIRMLSRSNVLVVVIIAIALIQFGASIWTGCLVFLINNLSNLQKGSFIQCSVWLGGSALCDTIIAVVMTFYLLKANAAMKSTQVLIARLIHLVIETGTATATVAIIDLILYVAVQKYPFHMLPSRSLAKVYSNTLLVILNSRIRIMGSRVDARLHPSFINREDWTDLKFASTVRNTTTSAMNAESRGAAATRVQYPTRPRDELNVTPLNELPAAGEITRSDVDDSDTNSVKFATTHSTSARETWDA
ncbi:hypothetical protein V5O48_005636 [Marasmius crinis-equi]|uniref:DUF6534 domain-containing protein n=1 Tax=Marasmius crinis-equi TaxID=585013 RepID=A0ABR3FLQ7_9AGAR